MQKNNPLTSLADLPLAFGLLTRLPLAGYCSSSGRNVAQSAWSWPLVGAITGLLAGLAGLFATWLGAGPYFAAGVALGAMIMLTGALHEDGLADTADGLWGGHDKLRRLEIMRDSRLGSYGVLALCLSVILRWSALVILLQSGWFLAAMMAIGMLSRVPMVVLLGIMPNARTNGLAANAGKPQGATILLALAIALSGALLLIGWGAIIAAFWISLSAIALAGLAKAKIGGQTGDILGASQQLGEILALASLAALAA